VMLPLLYWITLVRPDADWFLPIYCVLYKYFSSCYLVLIFYRLVIQLTIF
jgi:hypothetical protein